MKRICRSIPLFVLALCITGGALQAQEEKRGTNDSGAPNLAAYRNELLQNREHLNRAESAVAKIEREKRVTEEDSAAIDRELYAYATAIKSAYDRASQQAETAGKTKGKQGSVGHFITFEETAQADQKKVERIQKRLEAIDRKIQSKEIRLDERSSFRDPAAGSDVPAAAPSLYDTVVACLGGDWSLVDSAEASLALPCVAPCSAQNWGACAACIVSKAPGAVSAWNSFQSCWNGAHKPFQALKRAGCVAVFLARIA
ncbi:MAG TPA: hypothetical protein VFC23_08770 [Thermoanaerobaculia bacterium]|nr:hypothetical protein [Thermoanaerobaculia bacterium]